MAGKKIGIVLALDGERQFSQGVSNAKKESAMLNSELKKLSTEYKGNANSLEFLTKSRKTCQSRLRVIRKGRSLRKKDWKMHRRYRRKPHSDMKNFPRH